MKRYFNILIFVFAGYLATTAGNKYIERDFFHARLEPEKGVLHGAGQGHENTTFLEYSDVVKDTKPAIFMYYLGLNKSVDELMKAGKYLKYQLKSVPQDVRIQLGVSFNNKNSNGEKIDSIAASGMYDMRIDTIVSIMKSLNRPVYVRIGFECEGKWNGYRPEYYKTVYKKITEKMRKENVNGATVWCSAGGSAGFMPMDKLLSYYPGDEWVDWWGIDVFSANEFTDSRLANFFNTAKEHKKPVMIGESTPRYVGVKDGQKSWEKWYRPYFDMIYNFPQIKAFCYINWDWAYWGEKYGHIDWVKWGDGRIEQDDYVMEQYVKELKSDLFIHSTKKK